MKMYCNTCHHFVPENLFCRLWKTDTTPTESCTSYDRDPDEVLDAGDEVEIGVDMSLEEVDDLDGDDDETWATNVPCIGR